MAEQSIEKEGEKKSMRKNINLLIHNFISIIVPAKKVSSESKHEENKQIQMEENSIR